MTGRGLLCVTTLWITAITAAYANDDVSRKLLDAFNTVIIKPVNSAAKASEKAIRDMAGATKPAAKPAAKRKADSKKNERKTVPPLRQSQKREPGVTGGAGSSATAAKNERAGAKSPPLRVPPLNERWKPALKPTVTKDQSTSPTAAPKKSPPPTEEAKPSKADGKAEPSSDEKKTAEPPKPDLTKWSEVIIAAARAKCKKVLAGRAIEYTEEEPLRAGKTGRCGNAAPIRVTKVGKGDSAVEIVPAAKISCDLAAALHTWLVKHVQPLAKKHLKTRVTKLAAMSDYSCRTMYSRKGAKLSQHATMNALDIRGFRLADKRFSSILKDWGVTQRDIKKATEEAKKRAQEQAAEEARRKAEELKAKSSKPDKNKGSTPTATDENQDRTAVRAKWVPPIDATAAERLTRKLKQGQKSKNKTKGPKQVPRKKNAKVAIAKPLEIRLPAHLDKPISKSGHFLRAIHKSACTIFGTTLGPEANEPHRNHFHVDMATRKYRKICD